MCKRELIHEKDGQYFRSKVFKEGPYAIKCVVPKTEEAEERLFQEHNMLALLHERTFTPEHFVKPVDYKFEKGVYVLVTDWIDETDVGNPTSETIERDLRTIGTQLISCGIRHRDIWEPNLLLSKGRVILIDFGWAIEAGETDKFDYLLEHRDDDKAIQDVIARLKPHGP